MSEKKVVLTLSIMLITLSLIMFAFLPSRVLGQPAMVYVDDDNSGGPWDGSLAYPYQNITSGLEHAGPGDTVFVFNGLYIENVFLNKSVSIVGEDPINTIVDGNGTEFLSVIHIDTVSNAVIMNLTVQNTASGFGFGVEAGIYAWQSHNITVTNCTVTRSYYGLILGISNGCRIYENKFVDNYAYGIALRDGSSNNSIIANRVADNPTGIYFEDTLSQYNRFYRNNIMSNTHQITLQSGLNFWDNGAEGNHWDDYSGSDLDGDGIGDDSYYGFDMLPLVEPWSQTRVREHISVTCNYTVASIDFNESQREISFYITGPSSWKGFCNVTIPTDVLSLENVTERWLVVLGSNPMIYQSVSDSDSTVLSFEYTLGSSMLDNKVRITVEILNSPIAGFSFLPVNPVINEIVTFNASSSFVLNGTIIRYVWNFSDGSPTEEGLVVTHSFSSTGRYDVTLRIYDDHDIEDSTAKTVIVNDVDTTDNVDYVLPAILALIVGACIFFGFAVWKRKRSTE